MDGHSYEEREKALSDVISKDRRPDFIPVLCIPDSAVFGYSGRSLVDSFREDDDMTIAENWARYYDDVYFDITMGDTISIVPEVVDAFEGCTQMRYGPDGSTLENIQKSPMHDDEYGQLISDPDGFIKNVLLPRKYPFLFSGDDKAAAEKLKILLDANGRLYGSIFPACMDIVMGKGITFLGIEDLMNNPLDILFDSFRGFTGLLIDLRRRYDEVKAACEVFWETKCNRYGEGYELEGKMLIYAAHVAPYINAKCFDEIYWPYHQKMITDIGSHDDVLYHICQGTFLKRADHFNDVPEHSLIVHCDDDDPVSMSNICGNTQIISGGTAQVLLSHESLERCIDEAKRILDSCACAGSFIYSIDKTLSCDGDINDNLKAVNQYVHDNY